MSRTLARETATKLLYQLTFQDDCNWNDTLENTLGKDSLTDADIMYIDDVMTNINKHLDTIDGEITNVSHRWRIDRMSKVDLSILRLAVYEIRYREDIPNSVSINEAVEIAKKYGSEESSAFINGLLSSIVNGENE